jgi:hypothetical protein
VKDPHNKFLDPPLLRGCKIASDSRLLRPISRNLVHRKDQRGITKYHGFSFNQIMMHDKQRRIICCHRIHIFLHEHELTQQAAEL